MGLSLEFRIFQNTFGKLRLSSELPLVFGREGIQEKQFSHFFFRLCEAWHTTHAIH